MATLATLRKNMSNRSDIDTHPAPSTTLTSMENKEKLYVAATTIIHRDRPAYQEFEGFQTSYQSQQQSSSKATTVSVETLNAHASELMKIHKACHSYCNKCML